jgi:hypothetical protein
MFELCGFIDNQDVRWYIGSAQEVAPLLSKHHYLGPLNTGAQKLVIVGRHCDDVVAAQVWKMPTARWLPNDGTWLELARWCLTPEAEANAGSRMHRYSLPLLRQVGAQTLVSYSDPSKGHTGALYRACNWFWAPHWQRLRPPPTGGGTWDGVVMQSVKDRWIFHVAKRDLKRQRLHCDDAGAVRHWQRHATEAERRWAIRSPYMCHYVEGAAS